ncbi:MAG: hypothetical protein WCA38_10985 [Candidatus Acidiferrales bacterium]
METGKRARLAIVGGVFCAIVGTLVGVLLIALWNYLTTPLPVSRNPVASFLMNIWTMFVIGFIMAAPFGLIVGSIGSWWLAARASIVSARRFYCESAGIGALLGATFPLLAAIIFGLGPFRNLISQFPFSIGSGTICGLALAALVRSYVRRSSLHGKDGGRK